MTAAIASPMPVLPDVPSTIVPPGLRRPAFSASSIIVTAMRSLIELPGLKVSTLASTVASVTPLVIALIRTSGVRPIVSRMLPQMPELEAVTGKICTTTGTDLVASRRPEPRT
jgi:hypothetical protein